MADNLLPLPAILSGRVAPFRGDAAVLVSGGSDSVALLRLAAQYRLGSWRNLRVLHFDHQLRPESVEDANFVSGLAEQLRLPCDVVRLDPSRLRQGDGGLQASARQARRVGTLRYLTQHRLSWALLGHTLDDHRETIVGQIVRGRGAQDRKGIMPAFGAFVRPILGATRIELQQWLRSIDQPWRDDGSNAKDTYQRNYLRHHCLPALELSGSIVPLESNALHARRFWYRAHKYLMQNTGASPATVLALKMPMQDEALGLAICALWAGYRGVHVSRAQWSRVWRGGLPCQIDAHGGRLCRVDTWLWITRPEDNELLEASVRVWLALDKTLDVPILFHGMGYPPQSRFKYAGRSVSAKQVFRDGAIPAFLRSRVGWKVGPHGVRLFPAPRDGLTAVHLLP